MPVRCSDGCRWNGKVLYSEQQSISLISPSTHKPSRTMRRRSYHLPSNSMTYLVAVTVVVTPVQILTNRVLFRRLPPITAHVSFLWLNFVRRSTSPADAWNGPNLSPMPNCRKLDWSKREASFFSSPQNYFPPEWKSGAAYTCHFRVSVTAAFRGLDPNLRID